MSPGILPAAVEESADKVAVVLAAVAEWPGDMLQADSVGVGCAPGVAVEAEIVPAVAVRRAAETPVSTLGSWTGPVILCEGVLVKLTAAGFDQGDPAAGNRATGQSGRQGLENMGAETVGALGVGLAVAPVTVGTYVAADRVALLVRESQMLVQDVVALGKVLAHPVVLAGAGNRGLVVNEDPGQTGHNKVPGSESHSLLVLVDHRIPSVHMACFQCLQEYVPVVPLGIAGGQEGHTPDQGNQVPVAGQ